MAQIMKASSEVRSMILEDVSCITAMARDKGADGGSRGEHGGSGVKYQYDTPRSN